MYTNFPYNIIVSRQVRLVGINRSYCNGGIVEKIYIYFAYSFSRLGRTAPEEESTREVGFRSRWNRRVSLVPTKYTKNVSGLRLLLYMDILYIEVESLLGIYSLCASYSTLNRVPSLPRIGTDVTDLVS